MIWTISWIRYAITGHAQPDPKVLNQHVEQFGKHIKRLPILTAQVEELPDELASVQITKSQFVGFVRFWKQLRRVDVALDFMQLTSGSITAEDLARAAHLITGEDLASHQVRKIRDLEWEIFCALSALQSAHASVLAPTRSLITPPPRINSPVENLGVSL